MSRPLRYKERARVSREQVTGLRRRYENVKAELSGNETYQQMEMQEGRLRKYAQAIFNLQEFIETKGRSTDFESIKVGCMAMVEKLNAIAKENMAKAATNLSDAPLSSQFAQY